MGGKGAEGLWEVGRGMVERPLFRRQYGRLAKHEMLGGTPSGYVGLLSMTLVHTDSRI